MSFVDFFILTLFSFAKNLTDYNHTLNCFNIAYQQIVNDGKFFGLKLNQ